MRIVETWKAILDIDFETTKNSLREYLTNLGNGIVRPLSFGFVEFEDGFARFGYKEIETDNGTIFGIKIISISPETKDLEEDNVGAFIVHKTSSSGTLVSLQSIDFEESATLEVANRFKEEMEGKGIPTTIIPLPVDRVREFFVTGNLTDLVKVFEFMNQKHATFGLHIETPGEKEKVSGKTHFIILKSQGVYPIDIGRWEVGLIACKKVGSRISVEIHALNFKERERFWVFIGTLRRRLQEFNLIQETNQPTLSIINNEQIYLSAENFFNGDNKMTKNITLKNVHATGNIIIADSIEKSLNTVESADISQEIKDVLADLVRAVDIMCKELPSETAEEVAEDLEKLITEASKKSPKQKWYSVSIDGLQKAAKKLGNVGLPVIEIASKVLFLLDKIPNR